LRKEKEEERQLQELQRLQEEQTGKKRTEKLEWMYATPATGNGQSSNDLEDYLLGKKRVDKILTADDNAKVCPCSHLWFEYFFDTLFSSELPTRISLRFRMQIMPAILQQKFVMILCWRSSSKNRLRFRLCCPILFVSRRCRKNLESSLRTRRGKRKRRRSAGG